MKNFPLLIFVSMIILAGLACNAIAPQVESPPTTETNEIVEVAVATIEAQLPPLEEAPSNVSTTAPVRIDSDLETNLITLYEHVNPAVVFVTSKLDSQYLTSGSGFVYDAQGHIVTNNHVVADGNNFEIVFSDGRQQLAEFVGKDIDSDLAVLKVAELAEGIEPIPLADYGEVRVGQFVVAIGSPFGVQGSLSFGIVSGLGRSLASLRFTDDGGTYRLPDVIQTDAPINPGNSGGPLLNLQGALVGVNSAIRSETGFNSGVGFAIPVAAVKRIVPALIENGSYTYPYLGIATSGGPIDLERQELLNLTQATGVYVTSVTADGPAEEAGIIAAQSFNAPGGDLIVGIDDHEVNEFNDLMSYLVFETEVGQTVELTVIRNGEIVKVPLVLGERP